MAREFSVDALASCLAEYVTEPAAARYCVGYSGGLDSTTLLYTMSALRGRWPGAQVRALHVNHHLLSQADAWTAHCLKVATSLDVPCQVLDAQVLTGPGISTEAAAREARYRLFEEALGEGELLLTAHHRDDQLETVLLQLLRGAGVAGLAAMPVEAPFGRGRHLRPLLEFTRAELEAFARGTGLQWVEDTSNEALRYDRNYLRHRVVPLLRERWPGAVENVARSARHLAEAQALLDELARHDLALATRQAGKRKAAEEARETGDSATLSIEALRMLEPPRARNLLRFWIRSAGIAPPSTVKLQEILRQMLESRPDASPRVAWGTAEIRRHRGRLFLSSGEPPRRPDSAAEVL